ncbi:hypothetical protein [Microbulbifer discodermiae]|uniref:hypothetical protein n=1 Tax=Microbulbifer sp. 2201CG32-9 TaxID=3232309 RepID=UPI00345BD232
MDKQDLQKAIEEFLKSKEGAAMVAESLSMHFDRNDVVLLSPKEGIKGANEAQLGPS